MNPRNREVEVTQTVQVLEYLLKGFALTQEKAKTLFGCYHLASRINEIGQTHEIRTTYLPSGNGQTIAHYTYVRPRTPTEIAKRTRRREPRKLKPSVKDVPGQRMMFE